MRQQRKKNLFERGAQNGETLRDLTTASLSVDPILEQIERNRRIIEQLSPVLKYKEMMRKRRARTAPRRKFSIAQGYPRISRWKANIQPKSNSSGQTFYTNLDARV